MSMDITIAVTDQERCVLRRCLRSGAWCVCTWCLRRYSLFLNVRLHSRQGTHWRGMCMLPMCCRRLPELLNTLWHRWQRCGCIHLHSPRPADTRGLLSARPTFTTQQPWPECSAGTLSHRGTIPPHKKSTNRNCCQIPEDWKENVRIFYQQLGLCESCLMIKFLEANNDLEVCEISKFQD